MKAFHVIPNAHIGPVWLLEEKAHGSQRNIPSCNVPVVTRRFRRLQPQAADAILPP